MLLCYKAYQDEGDWGVHSQYIQLSVRGNGSEVAAATCDVAVRQITYSECSTKT